MRRRRDKERKNMQSISHAVQISYLLPEISVRVIRIESSDAGRAFLSSLKPRDLMDSCRSGESGGCSGENGSSGGCGCSGGRSGGRDGRISRSYLSNGSGCVRSVIINDHAVACSLFALMLFIYIYTYIHGTRSFIQQLPLRALLSFCMLCECELMQKTSLLFSSFCSGVESPHTPLSLCIPSSIFSHVFPSQITC